MRSWRRWRVGLKRLRSGVDKEEKKVEVGFGYALGFLRAMNTAMPMPTAMIIMAIMTIAPALAGGCSGVVPDGVAMYAVNVGSCSTL